MPPNALPEADDYTEASASADSALQWVSFELLDGHDLEPDEQHDILDPIVGQIEYIEAHAFRQAVSVMFARGVNSAANHIIETVLDELEYEHVPDELQDDVEDAVERRVREKHNDLVLRLDDIQTKMKSQVEAMGMDVLADWGPVV